MISYKFIALLNKCSGPHFKFPWTWTLRLGTRRSFFKLSPWCWVKCSLPQSSQKRTFPIASHLIPGLPSWDSHQLDLEGHGVLFVVLAWGALFGEEAVTASRSQYSLSPHTQSDYHQALFQAVQRLGADYSPMVRQPALGSCLRENLCRNGFSTWEDRCVERLVGSPGSSGLLPCQPHTFVLYRRLLAPGELWENN